MNFKEKNGISIDEAFKRFHKANPLVFTWFKNYFYYFHGRGKKRVSAKLIAECLRQEPALKTKSENYKLDNSFVSRYVRLFIKDHPQYTKCFELRKLKSDPVQAEMFK